MCDIFPSKISFSNAKLWTTGSICNRNGYLNIYPSPSNVHWHRGYETLSTYKFRTKTTISHRFCPNCGTSLAAEVFEDGTLMTAINVSVSYGAQSRKQANGAGR